MVVATYDDPGITNLELRIDRYPEIITALKSGRPVLVPEIMSEPMFADVRERWKSEGRNVRVRSVLAIPFTLDRKRSGVFFLRTEPSERQLSVEDADFAATVVKAAVAAIRRAQALETTRADNRRLEELATTDALTRLMNRRALLDRLNAEVDRARRFKKELSLLMLDLDHFKSVNDSHGHLVGDAVLRQTGGAVEHRRAHDRRRRPVRRRGVRPHPAGDGARGRGDIRRATPRARAVARFRGRCGAHDPFDL